MNIQDSRILIKRSTITGVTPTIPTSSDHTDGSWITTDIYKGELFINMADSRVWTRVDSGIVELPFSSIPAAGDWYLSGDSTTDGSIRFHYDAASDEILAQKRISGVWVNGTTIVDFS